MPKPKRIYVTVHRLVVLRDADGRNRTTTVEQPMMPIIGVPIFDPGRGFGRRDYRYTGRTNVQGLPVFLEATT